MDIRTKKTAWKYVEDIPNDNRETGITHIGGAQEWRFFTNEKKYIGKMRSLGIEPYEIDGDSHFYKLNMNQISFKKGLPRTKKAREE